MKTDGRAAIKHRTTVVEDLKFPSGVEAVAWLLAGELVARGIYDRRERQKPLPLYAGNALPILTRTGKHMIYRPDLILWRGDEARVIDIKGRMDHSQEDLYRIKVQLVAATYHVAVETWRAADIKRIAAEHGIDLRAIARQAGVEWALWTPKKEKEGVGA